jgi:hypothetical protein
MKKFLVLLLILIIAPLIGGLYGIIHDQFTYTISNEYFTKFKFYQFGLMDVGNEAIFPNPRIQVSIIGFLATWWLGIPIGLILGFEGLRNKDAKTMFSNTFRALLVNVLSVFIVSIVGFAYGYLYLRNLPIENFSSWYIPDNIIDVKSYINVCAMHNFSYVGGILGLIVALIYSSRRRKKTHSSF